MKKILVTKETPTFELKGQVADILSKSKCPNESFTNTFGDEYKGMDDGHVYIGVYSGVETEIEYDGE